MLIHYSSLCSSTLFQCQVPKGDSLSVWIMNRYGKMALGHQNTGCGCALRQLLLAGVEEGVRKGKRWLGGECLCDRGQIECLKAATNKTGCQQTPLKLAGIFLRQQCVICVIEVLLPIWKITFRKRPHYSCLAGNPKGGCHWKTSPTGWPNNFFTLTWVHCMPIDYLALCFVFIFL